MAYNNDRNDRRDRRNRDEAPSEFIEKLVSLNRVSKTVKGGRVAKFSALCVVGDGKGRVGYGMGKANEVSEAIRKGLEDAKKNIVTITLSGTTIPHEVLAASAPAACSSSPPRKAPASSPAAPSARWSRPPVSPTSVPSACGPTTPPTLWQPRWKASSPCVTRPRSRPSGARLLKKFRVKEDETWLN